MPFERPTLTALTRQARADIADATKAYAILRASPMAILAKTVAGLTHGLYGFLDWIARQANPFTAEGIYLVAWAALVGIFRKGAETATATVTFQGTPNAPLPNGTLIARAADGVTYRTTALGTVGAGNTVTVPIEAVAAGALGNALGGAEVSIAGSAPGIAATGTLATPAAGGADEEDEDDFRERMLERYRNPPQGGNATDYVAWAKQVPGITRAWVRPLGGALALYIMLDDTRASIGGFPQGTDGVAGDDPRAVAATGDQRIVADHLSPLRPVTALVYVVRPTTFAVNLTIADLAEDSPAIRAAITTALRGMFRLRGAPGGTIYQSDLSAAIDAVDLVGRFTLTAPAVSLTAPTGALPVLGTVTWA